MAVLQADILKLLGGSHFKTVTTLIDFYAYPKDGPGADCRTPHVQRECVLERARQMARDIDNPRFLPFVMLHEFETMVFGAALARTSLLGSPEFVDGLRAEAAGVGDDVELINDDPNTAPSKRVARLMPEYQKVVDGVAANAEEGD